MYDQNLYKINEIHRTNLEYFVDMCKFDDATNFDK